LVSETNTLSN